MPRPLSFLLACATLLPLGLWAAPPVIPAAVKTSARQRVDYGYAPGIVVAMVNADGRTFYSHGRRDWSPGSPTTDETTLYEIGSVTKTFTTALLAEMVSRGEVALSTKAQALLPPGVSMPAGGGDEITLLHLATHRSGLAVNPANLFDSSPPSDNPFEKYAVEDLYNWFARDPLPRRPGVAYEYSNSGIGLLGHLLALSQGVDYETLLETRILSPLGMADTRSTLSPGQLARFATGHAGVVVRPPFAMKSLEAAGNLRSTAADLMTWLEHQMGLRASPLNAALATTQTPRAASDSPSYGLGLAWWRWNFSDVIIQHGGDTMGSTAFVAWRPATRVGVVILCNARANSDVALLQIGFNCLTSEVSVNTPVAPAAVPESVLRKYVGQYGPENAGFIAKLERGRLILAYSGQAFFTIYPQSQLLFRAPDVASSAVFGLNASGGGELLRWTQAGTTLPFDRVRRPPRLTLAGEGGAPVLSLTGEGDLTYALERSGDLAQWEFVQNWTVWDAPLPQSAEGARGFFRLRAP